MVLVDLSDGIAEVSRVEPLMLRVPITQTSAGMRLAMAVLHPQRGNVLLNAGFAIKQSHVAKLKELGVHEVWIEYPGTEEIKRFVSPAVMHTRSSLVSLMADTFDDAHSRTHARLDYASYRSVLTELIEELVIDTAAATYVAEIAGRNNSELRHSAEVCTISILLGLKLQGYVVKERHRLQPRDAKNLVSLGLGAMLHDVGYLKLDDEVRQRYLETRDQADHEWQQHVAHGYAMVNDDVRPSAAGIILQHHQYFDGSGFPKEIGEADVRRGRKGGEIHVFARIVTVADHFDRLSRQPGAANQPRVRVLRAMLWGPLASRFDPVVLTALPKVVPAYPPGTMVTLSTGEQAVVMDWDALEPCRPVVQVIPEGKVTSGDETEQGPRYDLRIESDLSIAEQEGMDVLEDNFSLRDDGEVGMPSRAA